MSELEAALDRVRQDPTPESLAKAWEPICVALDGISEAALDSAIASVDEVTAGIWLPYRRVMHHWWSRIEQGKREPRIAAARSLSLRDIRESTIEFLTHAPELLHIERLGLMDAPYDAPFKPKYMRPFTTSPWVRNLRYLSVGLPLGDSGLGHLCRSTHLAGVETLVVYAGNFKSRAGRALAKRKAFLRLRELQLYRCHIGKAGIEELVAGDWSALELLTLEECGLNAEALAILAATEFPQLTQLRLNGNDIGAALGDALASAPWIAQLESVAMESLRLDMPSAKRLFKTLESSPLTHLDLSLNGELADFTPLLKSPVLSRLTSLRLSYCDLQDDAVQALTRLDLPHLEHLSLGGSNAWSSQTVDALVASPLLAQLKHITVPRSLDEEARERIDKALTRAGAYLV